MALSQDQFEALLDHIPTSALARNDDQRGQKAQELSVVDFDTWHIRKKRFISIVRVNRWSNSRARMELSICITGDARKRVDNAPNNRAANNVNYMDTLADIERWLIPKADCDMT